MNKSLISAVSTTAVAATAVPTTFLASSSNSNNENLISEETTVESPVSKISEEKPVKKQTKPFNKPKWPEKLIPQLSVAKDISGKYGSIACLKRYFPTIKWNKVASSSLKSDDVIDFSDKSDSCLLVEYYKQTYKDNKWWGEFRLIWSIKDEVSNQGLITVTNVRTSSGKLWGSSSAYILKKDNTTSWSIRYAQEIGESFKTDDGLNRLIPQRTLSIPRLENMPSYWGFNPDLKKICNTGDCEEAMGAANSASYSWEFVRDGTKGIVHFWASSIYNWLDWIFKWQALENKMNNVRGYWQEKK